MRKYILFLLASILMMSACATEKIDIKGSEGEEIPTSFSSFPDIPFPSDSKIDLKSTNVLGNGDLWIGSLVFNTPYNASRVFDFYTVEMPKYKWVEIATTRARISQMTYFRKNRAIQILIEMNNEDESKITLTAFPNQATALETD